MSRKNVAVLTLSFIGVTIVTMHKYLNGSVEGENN